MKVLFLNPPFFDHFSRIQRSPAVTKGGTLYYPYWLCFAAGVTMREGIECDLIDAVTKQMSCAQIVERVKMEGYDIIVCDTSTPSIENDISIIEAIKNAAPGVKIILVGTHVSSLPEETLRMSSSIDIVVRGEYDFVVSEIVKCNGDYSEVNGITFRNKNGDIVSTPFRPLLTDIDGLPSLVEVYQQFLDIHDYYFAAADYPMVMLVTGRGCYGKCFFCLYPQTMFGRKYRYMSAKRVVEEMTATKQTFPDVKEIVFEDDTFTADVKRMREICQMLIAKPIDLKWTCNTRVQLDLETMKLMKMAGCRLLVAGFESGNQDLLDRMNKGITLDQSRIFAKNAKKAGLLVHGCFMFGFPGETEEMMERTVHFAIELDPDSAQFYPLFVYPGTEAYQWARAEQVLQNAKFSKWIDERGQHRSLINLGNGITPEYLTLFCERAYSRYHLRPRYVIKKIKQLCMDPREGMRSLRSAYNYFIRK